MAVVGGFRIEFEGVDEFRRLLRAATGKWDNVLRESNRQISQSLVRKMRGATETRQQARAVGAIAPRGDRRGAVIVMNKRPPFAPGAFYGALQYRQFPEWVGNSWDVGGSGGPAAINPTIRDNLGEIIDAYGDSFERICAQAFPDGRPARRSSLIGPGSF